MSWTKPIEIPPPPPIPEGRPSFLWEGTGIREQLRRVRAITEGATVNLPTPVQVQIVHDVIAERGRQDAKFGADRMLEPFTMAAVLGEEYGEVCQAALHAVFGGPAAAGLRDELVQVAAVAVCWIEMLDRQRGIVHPRAYWTKDQAQLLAEHQGDAGFKAAMGGCPCPCHQSPDPNIPATCGDCKVMHGG